MTTGCSRLSLLFFVVACCIVTVFVAVFVAISRCFFVYRQKKELLVVCMLAVRVMTFFGESFAASTCFVFCTEREHTNVVRIGVFRDLTFDHTLCRQRLGLRRCIVLGQWKCCRLIVVVVATTAL